MMHGRKNIKLQILYSSVMHIFCALTPKAFSIIIAVCFLTCVSDHMHQA